MIAHGLHQLPPSTDRAVIINVATEVVSSLAIASALRHLDMPLAVLNCTATGVSKRLMDTLAEEWKFDLVDQPLAEHGVTIDRIFNEVFADRIVLLDSDAEILSPEPVARMRAALAESNTYGSGWVHPSQWLTEHESNVSVPVLYAERPWIPFAMFRTSFVRAAIANGVSFREKFVPGASGELVTDASLLSSKPTLIHGDTGAEIHYALTRTGLRFDGPDVEQATNDVKHYHGVSRLALAPKSANGTPLDRIENEVLTRLRTEYPEFWPGFAAAVTAAQV